VRYEEQDSMSELRQDPLTRDWVVLSPDRAKRPRDTRGGTAADCPFCAGHESDTPPEVDRMTVGGNWVVRVVPNRYALLERDAPEARSDGYGRRERGAGAHEVIVETPDHERTLGTLPRVQLRRVLGMYLRRARVLAGSVPAASQIVVFRNQGARAGTSLTHPHSQIVATPVVSPEVRRRTADEIAWFDGTGRCATCEMLERELACAARVVLETPGFVTVAPFASPHPCQLQIVPRCHTASFLDADEGLLDDLAQHLHEVAVALEACLEAPHYNLVVLTPPIDQIHRRANHWLIELVPRLTTPAGFELGARIRVNTVSPEDAAARLRSLIDRT
jgi:UDPglucose--hexose-1-phosphate uridylyltransferase